MAAGRCSASADTVLQVVWRNARAEATAEHLVLVDAASTAADVIAQLRPLLEPSVREAPIRCIEYDSHRIARVRRPSRAAHASAPAAVQHTPAAGPAWEHTTWGVQPDCWVPDVGTGVCEAAHC